MELDTGTRELRQVCTNEQNQTVSFGKLTGHSTLA